MDVAGVSQSSDTGTGPWPETARMGARPGPAVGEDGWIRSRVDEEAARRLIEAITQRIDPHAQVLLREPGPPVLPNRLRLALIQQGHTYPFELTTGELREARSALGRERLARRLGATLGLQPPDQLTGPPRD